MKKNRILGALFMLFFIAVLCSGCGKQKTEEPTDTAWIPEREAIVTLWNINWSRGAYMDMNTEVKTNVMYFTREQIYEYVRMLKFCGFTGVQLTDMCSAWAGLGSYEAVHEKLRIFAEAAHSMDMKFTLWVWGAEFSDCGWVDDSVFYGCEEHEFVSQCPEAIATFEKYYDIYAELADCCDRVIGHYYDPSNLYNETDIGYFAKMLREKFRAKNPEIDFGLSCWIDVYDKDQFIAALGNDVMLLEGGHHDDPNMYYHFHTKCVNFDCELGTWAWNTCEMEIDQLAQMNFNLDIIRNVYQTARQYDEIKKSSYWSEMDSNHVLNVFSLYCAGQLLQDPDMPSEDILRNLSVATVGEDYAQDFAETLLLIQAARSGSEWDTYFWNRDRYVLKSDEYPTDYILKQSEESIALLQKMIKEDLSCNTLPLPISLCDLLQLMLPHLQQIHDYAVFRQEYDCLKVEAAEGMDAETLSKRVQAISKAISNYNTVVGAWGQIEARAQHELLDALCKQYGIETPIDPVLHRERKNRIYAQLVSYQRGKKEPYILYEPYYQLGLAYGLEETKALVDELVEEGVFIRLTENSVYLADWQNTIYHFD